MALSLDIQHPLALTRLAQQLTGLGTGTVHAHEGHIVLRGLVILFIIVALFTAVAAKVAGGAVRGDCAAGALLDWPGGEADLMVALNHLGLLDG